MRIYEVSYWEEGPGMSHTETVVVVARTKKDAIDLVNDKCGVYKADKASTSAKLVVSSFRAKIISWKD